MISAGNRNFIIEIVPELETMPRNDAIAGIALIGNILIDLDKLAKKKIARGELTYLEYETNMKALSFYIKARAHELSPENFLRFLETIRDSSGKLKDVAALVREIVPLDAVTAQYSAIKDSKPKQGMKFVMLYDSRTGSIETVEVRANTFYAKDEGVIVLAVKRAGDKFKVFKRNIKTNCPWIAPMGMLRILEGIRKARKTIGDKEIVSRVPGSGNTPLTKGIADKYVLSIIYAEKHWSGIVRAKSDDEVRDYMDSVHLAVALDGNEAYSNIESPRGAQGIAQITSITHQDIVARYPGTLPNEFAQTACDLDNALLAIFLIIDRKRESICAQLNREGIPEDTQLAYFFDKHPSLPSKPGHAIAIAYNSNLTLAARYVLNGNLDTIIPEVAGYVASIERTLPAIESKW